MLEERDIQIISQLLDKKLEDFAVIVNRGFNHMESRFTGLEKRMDKMEAEIQKRPTREEIFRWADERIVNLELRADNIDYLHITELKTIPAPIEVRKVLVATVGASEK